MNGFDRKDTGRRRREGGFTIIEVIVAFSLIVIAALAAISTQRVVTAVNRESHRLHQATLLATDLLEAARNLEYDDPRLAATGGFATPDASIFAFDGAPGSPPPILLGYRRTWDVDDDTPVENVKQIRARVRWEEAGVQRTLILATLRAQ